MTTRTARACPSGGDATARRVTLTEAQIQRGLTDLLRQLGFSVYHTEFAIRSDKGFPDLVAVRDDGKLVAIECKGPKGRIRPGQGEWIMLFRSVPSCLFADFVGPSETADWWGYDRAIEFITEMLEEAA